MTIGRGLRPQAPPTARAADPTLLIDGELQGDAALSPEVALRKVKGESAVAGHANVLVFPDLDAGNIAYKLLTKLGGATAIGPILVGMAHPVHVLEQNADVEDIVNMAAVAVIDAQWRVRTTSASYIPVGTTGEMSVTNGDLLAVPTPTRPKGARPASRAGR